MLSSFDLTPALDAYGHLWMAVLRQAIDDATMEPTTSEARVEQRRARVWLKQAADYIGSLQWICDVLNIEVRLILDEFKRRADEGGIRRRRRAVAFAYHKRSK
jgi:hypothetical protein